MPIKHSPMLKASLAALVAGLALIEAAPQDSPRTFPTPQAAAQALVEAAAQNDTAALLKVLGPGGKDIVQSGDAADDKAARTEFAAHARARLQVESDRDNPNIRRRISTNPKRCLPGPSSGVPRQRDGSRARGVCALAAPQKD